MIFPAVSRLRVWSLWLLSAAVIVAVQAWTLTLSPPIWMDEVQIVDFGRTAFPGADLGWGLNWQLEGRPYYWASYLGPLLQEAGFLVADGDLAGVRLTSMLGAAFASGAMFAWLLARGISAHIACVAAVLFLMDPLICQGYRGGRVDALAMGFAFLACAVIQERDETAGRFRLALRGAAAGALLGLAALAWTSAVLLGPLFVYELATRLKGTARREKWLMWPTAAGGLALVLLLSQWAMGPMADAAIDDLARRVADVAGASRLDPRFWLAGMVALADSFKYSPWLPLAGGVFLVQGRRTVLALVVVAIVLCVVYLQAYVHRAVYIVPYLVLAVATGATDLSRGGARRAALLALALLTAWAAIVTLGARTLHAWSERAQRNPQIAADIASQAIGQGAFRVFLGTSHFYYAGRNLGWRIYGSLAGVRDLAASEWLAFLRTMDYVVLEEATAGPVLRRELENMGFALRPVSPNRRPAERRGDVYAGYLVYEKGRSGSPR